MNHYKCLQCHWRSEPGVAMKPDCPQCGEPLYVGAQRIPPPKRNLCTLEFIDQFGNRFPSIALTWMLKYGKQLPLHIAGYILKQYPHLPVVKLIS